MMLPVHIFRAYQSVSVVSLLSKARGADKINPQAWLEFSVKKGCARGKKRGKLIFFLSCFTAMSKIASDLINLFALIWRKHVIH